MHPLSRRALLGMSLALEGGLLALAHLLGLAFGVPAWATLRLEASAFFLGSVATLPLLLFLIFSMRTSWGPLRRLCHQMEGMARSLFEAATGFDLALVALLAGVCEETFFRGFLHALLAREWGQGVALASTAALFALVHPVSRLYATVAAAMSLYLGALFIVSQNLLLPIVVHGLYDFLALLAWRRRVRLAGSGGADADEPPRTGPSSSPRHLDGGDH